MENNTGGGGGARNQDWAAASTSPYVRAQASSLVAWLPLDETTVACAKEKNKLIFLHIGFSACHYCHLTEQDSFNNPAVADLLNEAFIPVIVDREERPDLDNIYQSYMQAANSIGGWPLNVFLTPELEPVFAGTYWPGPGTEHSSAGTFRGLDDDVSDGDFDFLIVLKKVRDSWIEEEERCRKEAHDIISQLFDFAVEGVHGVSGASPQKIINRTNGITASNTAVDATAGQSTASQSQPLGGSLPVKEMGDVDLDQLDDALMQIARTFDSVHGGFGQANKFPAPAKLSFLLRLEHFPREVHDVVDAKYVSFAAHMAVDSLKRIRDGGLHDHVGGGFFRYSQTADWALPRFEKMVADNALLLGVYLDAWLGQVSAEKVDFTNKLDFGDVVYELADYLASSPICLETGGFATSEAADSYYNRGAGHMREGAYYLWTRREFERALSNGANSAEELHAVSIVAAHFEVSVHGNVDREQDPHDEFINQNVLHVGKTAAELSAQYGLPVAEVRRRIDRAKAKLLAHRESERVRPATDRKVIVSINGSVVSALARTAVAVRNVDPGRSARYLAAAQKAVEFIRQNLWDAEAKVLYRSHYDGVRSNIRGFADDYAFLIEGLLDLYEATGDEGLVKWADELQQIQIKLFYDHPDRETEALNKVGASGPAAQCSLSGGFYSTEANAPHTILRLKAGMDNTLPAANATSAANLLRLGTLLLDSESDRARGYALLARETVNAFEPEMLQFPGLFTGLLTAVVATRLGVRHWLVGVDAQEQENLQGASSQQPAASVFTTPRAEPRAVFRTPSASSSCSWLREQVPLYDTFVRSGKRGAWKRDEFEKEVAASSAAQGQTTLSSSTV